MKIFILQLSDIHIKNESDPILSRVGSIIKSIQNIESNCDAIVCVLSGDIVYSGSNNEYDLALNFIIELKNGVDEAFSPLVLKFVAVPGNHDCDFKDSMAVRDSVLPRVLEKPDLISEESYATICLDPLKRFYDFIKVIDMVPLAGCGDAENQFVREYRLNTHKEGVTFLCYNTAATSSRHEKPGTLIFPNKLIPDSKASEDVVISIYHHPSNWLEPVCSRTFRNKIEAISDIVLTGHEHVVDRRQTNSDRGQNLTLEGGALQENSDPSLSEFNVLILNTNTKKKRLISYGYKGNEYIPQNCDDPNKFHLWEDFHENTVRTGGNFQILPLFLTKLDDPEITLTHRIKGQLKLSDVYIYPDLRRFNQFGEKGDESIRGDDILDLVRKRPNLFLVGDDQSGKTALSKRLFLALRERGDIPILIDVAKQHLSQKNCAKDLENAFLANYNSSALNAYRQCDKARRVVIIDNYHKAKVTAKDRHLLLTAVKEHAFRVIVFAHDTALTMQDLSGGMGSSVGELSFAYYGIRQFSYSQQNKLIEKWLLLNGDTPHNTAPFVLNLERIRRMMETIFGKNYVPAFPPYLLSILQATESGTDLDLKANTHGYFYELFIKQSIAKHSLNATTTNILSGYLSHIAEKMFSAGKYNITESELKVLHATLHEDFEVLPDFAEQAKQLSLMQLLVKHEDAYTFRHPYIFYYFLAYYLNAHLSETLVGEMISRMVGELYKEQSASTLLFLSHLSKDVRLLDALLEACDDQYKDSPLASLGEDVGFLSNLQGEVRSLVIPDGSIEEMRNQELERVEKCRQDELTYEEIHKKELEDQDTLLGQLNAALKTIQILGQFLKNFPIDLGKAKKDRIITSSCGLAARVLGFQLKMIGENKTAVLKEMIFLIKSQRPDFLEERLKGQAVNAIVSLSELICFGIISRLSYSLGSGELMNTYERYFGNSDAPFMRLTYTAILLDNYSSFPSEYISDDCNRFQKEPFSFRLLQMLVGRHMFRFPVDFKIRQRMSHILRLDYKNIRNPRFEQQVLKAK